jgi:hypothetical protein
MSASGTSHAPSVLSYRVVALPAEHGGWGLLLEPLALGLALAPSPAALALAVAAVGAFLARHPLKLVLADRRRGARYPRTALAERAAAAYAGVAALGAVGAIVTAPAVAWLPLLAAAPLGLGQLWYDARHQGRRLAPELLGAVALGATSSALVLAGGWPLPMAITVWALMALKGTTSVTYVRARLRLDRGQPAGVAAAIAVQTAALAAAAAFAGLGTAPRLAVPAFGVLLLRAAHGLAPARPPRSTRAIGFAELGYGVLTAGLLAAGYLLGA